MSQSLVKTFIRDLIVAIVIVILAGALGLLVNSIRGDTGIPLHASEPYNIFVPCPEPQGEATALSYDEFEQLEYLKTDGVNTRILLIDSRDRTKYEARHLKGALSIPYDFLEPVHEEHLQNIVNKAPTRVIVYGEIDLVHIGEELAKELAGHGIKNVYYIKEPVDTFEKDLVHP
jgi:rhodanese-related sulfurtransferase